MVKNILFYAHKTSRTFPTFDVSLGSVMLPAPKAAYFVELILV